MSHDHSRIETNHGEEAANQEIYAGVNPEFTQQLRAAVLPYLALKNALVASEAKPAATAAEQMQQTLANVDVTLVEGEAYQQWMEHLDVMQETLRTIAAEATLETQRAALAPLSQALYRSLRQFAATGLAIYYQHCPMADSNQGAYWLSESKEIRNPYFGDKMLTCGSLKETIN